MSRKILGWFPKTNGGCAGCVLAGLGIGGIISVIILIIIQFL